MASDSLIYNFSKFSFIYYKFKFQPYTLKSLLVLSVIFLVNFIGYLMPEFSYNPMVNVLVKGIVVSVLYIGAIYQFKISPEIFEMVKQKLFKKA